MTHRTDFSEATPEEIAAEVSEALRRHGIPLSCPGAAACPSIPRTDTTRTTSTL